MHHDSGQTKRHLLIYRNDETVFVQYRSPSTVSSHEMEVDERDAAQPAGAPKVGRPIPQGNANALDVVADDEVQLRQTVVECEGWSHASGLC